MLKMHYGDVSSPGFDGVDVEDSVSEVLDDDVFDEVVFSDGVDAEDSVFCDVVACDVVLAEGCSTGVSCSCSSSSEFWAKLSRP